MRICWMAVGNKPSNLDKGLQLINYHYYPCKDIANFSNSFQYTSYSCSLPSRNSSEMKLISESDIALSEISLYKQQTIKSSLSKYKEMKAILKSIVLFRQTRNRNNYQIPWKSWANSSNFIIRCVRHTILKAILEVCLFLTHSCYGFNMVCTD